METHAASTIQWQSSAIDSALLTLRPLFDAHRGPAQVRASWQGAHPTAPSAPIIAALRHLVSSVRRLGVPPGIKLDTVPKLLAAFRKAVREMDGWPTGDAKVQPELAAQAAFDLALLNLLVSSPPSDSDGLITSLLAHTKSSPELAGYADALPSLATEALRRTQVVLYPLITHLSNPAPEEKRERGRDRNAALLRLGAPAIRGGVGAEFKSPLAVARPGKRFGLLSIVA